MNLSKIISYFEKYKRISLVQRISIIPIIAVFLAITLISYISAYNIKNSLIEEMHENGVFLSQQFSNRISERKAVLEALEEQLNDKIRVAAKMLLNEKNLNNATLDKFAKELDVDELHWLDSKGEIVYSTVPGYIGWQTTVDHPLNIILQGQNELMEKVRPDVKYGKLMKYGAVRATAGHFVQVGISAERIGKINNRFSYQKLVESLALERNIIYVGFVDSNYKIIAHSDSNLLGKQLPKYEYLQNVIEAGDYQAQELEDEKHDFAVYDILFPIILEGKIVGALELGYSTENINIAVKENNLKIFLWGFCLLIIVTFSLRKTLKNQIIKPILKLEADIQAISLEHDINYRVPIVEDESFVSLRKTINNNLDKSQEYFAQMLDNQKELHNANEELEAVIGQLSASEEELHAQYDEIQDYALKMKELKEKYTLAIEATDSIIWEINLKDKTIAFSENFSRIVNNCLSKVTVREFIEENILQEDQEQMFKSLLEHRVQENNVVQAQFQLIDKHGKLRWYLMRGKEFLNLLEDQLYLTGVLVDISEYKKQEAYIQFLADHDNLTELYNKRKFLEKLNMDLKANKKGAILLLDIDNFKNINDALGHVYGDKVLKNVATLLKNIVGSKSAVYRFGGDEFLIRLVGQTEINDIENLILKISERLKQTTKVEEISNHLTMSIGIAFYFGSSDSVDELLIKADMAMYSAKRAGKNQYRVFNESMNKLFREKIEIEKILRQALDRQEFQILYQPVIEAVTGEVAYFEALLRINDKNISPNIFIPIAEETGLIVPIGKLVIDEVLRQLRSWLDRGYKPKPVAINLSPRQIAEPFLVEFIEAQLDKYSIKHELLEIEITENVLLENREETMVIMEKIQALGISIALDDFGTGFSSLNYLTFIPVNKIKLDKSLKDKFISLENIQVMDSIIALVHGLQLRVVIEGVEDISELAKLKRAGSDYMQGFLFSKPVSGNLAEKLFEKNYLS